MQVKLSNFTAVENISKIAKNQDLFFKSYATFDLNFRIGKLKKLKEVLQSYEKDLFKALKTDLGKGEFEVFTNEYGLALKEISYHIRNLKSWALPKKVSTPIYSFPSKSSIHKQPYGKILIIGPFNFPFMLTIVPLIGAVSAGNVVCVKPSENTHQISGLIKKIIDEVFNPSHVACIEGGVETTKELLAIRWDLIFFTGSTRVGRIVMEAAAKNLTPVVLELGGKNPVVVDKDARLEVAAKRIVWAKYLNTGQSCVAPDYLFVHENVKDKLLPLLKKYIKQFYTENPKESKDFGRIVNKENVERLSALIKDETIYIGGETDKTGRYFSPTLLNDVQKDSPIMKDEVFGPVLPVLIFNELDEVTGFLNNNEKPLAAYYFSENKKSQKEFLAKTFSGGVGINELVVQFVNFSLPFGGVGFSGIGVYHGKHSLDTFSHKRSVIKTTTLIDIPLRYPPIKQWVFKLVKMIYR